MGICLKPRAARISRSMTVTSPVSMSTGQGFRHLWQMVQWSATSSRWRSSSKEPERWRWAS